MPAGIRNGRICAQPKWFALYKSFRPLAKKQIQPPRSRIYSWLLKAKWRSFWNLVIQISSDFMISTKRIPAYFSSTSTVTRGTILSYSGPFRSTSGAPETWPSKHFSSSWRRSPKHAVICTSKGWSIATSLLQASWWLQENLKLAVFGTRSTIRHSTLTLILRTIFGGNNPNTWRLKSTWRREWTLSVIAGA